MKLTHVPMRTHAHAIVLYDNKMTEYVEESHPSQLRTAPWTSSSSMLTELGMLVHRRVSGAVLPFFSSVTIGAARNARRNKGAVVGLLVFFAIVLLFSVYMFIKAVSVNDVEHQLAALEAIKNAFSAYRQSATKQPYRASPRDTYSLSTRAFIQDIKGIDTDRVFEWHTDGVLDYATYRPRCSTEPNSLLKILVVGQLHARELFSADVARLWMAATMSQHRETGCLVNHTLSTWMFVPVANPCGRDMVARAYSMISTDPNTTARNLVWQICKRGNCDGVDLNRNWITYSSSLYRKTSALRLQRGRFWDGFPETNPGPEAFSERETKSLRAVIHEYAPDLVISLHTGGVGFFHPPEDGDREEDQHENFSNTRLGSLQSLATWARRKAKIARSQQKHLEDVTAHISGGSLLDYCLRHDVPLAFTAELYVGDETAAKKLGTSPPEYHGKEEWGSNPLDCHSFYNPPQAFILDSANRWLRLWKALFYLNQADGAFFASLLRGAAEEGRGDGPARSRTGRTKVFTAAAGGGRR